MHDYSIDKHPKEKILFFLAFVAIASAPFVNSGLISVLAAMGVKLGWAKVPALAIPTFTLFVLIYIGFNKYLWRIGWLRKFLLVPDLNGVWDCQGKTVLKNGQSVTFDWSGIVTITQSWSKILIYLKTDKSSSKSVAASIQYVDGVGYTLLYQYENCPEAGENELAKHSGAVEILVASDGKNGNGHYFSDQHRSTVGTMTLTKD